MQILIFFPGRHGQHVFLPEKIPQDRIDEFSVARMGYFFCEFYRFIDRRCIGDGIQENQLIQSEAEQQAHRNVQFFHGTAAEPAYDPEQGIVPAAYAVDQLCQKAPLLRPPVIPAEELLQCEIGIRILFKDSAERVIGGAPRRGRRFSFPFRHEYAPDAR